MEPLQIGKKMHLMRPLVRRLDISTPYKLFKPKRWIWLARLAWWVLKKLRALEPWCETVTTYTYQRQNHDDINQALRELRQDITRAAARSEDFAVIVGEHTFNSIVHRNKASLRHFVLQGGALHYPTTGGYRGSVLGFPIHIVPYVEGMAVVPKVVIEKVK